MRIYVLLTLVLLSFVVASIARAGDQLVELPAVVAEDVPKIDQARLEKHMRYAYDIYKDVMRKKRPFEGYEAFLAKHWAKDSLLTLKTYSYYDDSDQAEEEVFSLSAYQMKTRLFTSYLLMEHYEERQFTIEDVHIAKDGQSASLVLHLKDHAVSALPAHISRSTAPVYTKTESMCAYDFILSPEDVVQLDSGQCQAILRVSAIQ